MNLEQAKAIYAHPNGHTKEELWECIEVLNEAAQPVELNDIQFAAMEDAHRRLRNESPD